jgi:hypothetical protein
LRKNTIFVNEIFRFLSPEADIFGKFIFRAADETSFRLTKMNWQTLIKRRGWTLRQKPICRRRIQPQTNNLPLSTKIDDLVLLSKIKLPAKPVLK